MHQTLNTGITVLAAWLCIYSASIYALPSDNKEKVYIIADTTNYNYKTGVTQYDGHVKVDQGTTHITADRLITKNNNAHKMQEATAYGLTELAHYWTQPKQNEPEVHAHASIIRFYPSESNVTLEREVLVTQGENSFQGQLIHYNSIDQTITVPASKNGRAILVYNPDK